MKVLVLLGGDSPEREISLLSGQGIISGLESDASIELKSFDPLYEEGLSAAVSWADVVLPIVHGVNCEDGKLQKRLEDLGAKYLGSDSVSSANCFDKQSTHKILEPMGVHMPVYKLVTKKDLDHPLFDNPFVLKPNNTGSSVDTLVVRVVTEEAKRKVEELLASYDEMLLEELIEGVEITVPVLGDDALPVIMIVAPHGEEFDLANKYNGRTQEVCPVPSEAVPAKVQIKAQELALKIHKAMNCRHLSRTDMFMKPDGELVVLEINTIPGLTAQSLFPKAAAVAGYNMEKLTQIFIELVKKGK